MDPLILFSLQFTLSLIAYLLIGFWYVRPRLDQWPRAAALAPLVWVHAFRIIGGTILAPGSVEAAVPPAFRVMIGLGDMATAALALVWLCVGFGMLDTVNAIIQSMRDNVFSYALGFNWVIVAIYVPALLVSSLLIVLQLLRPAD